MPLSEHPSGRELVAFAEALKADIATLRAALPRSQNQPNSLSALESARTYFDLLVNDVLAAEARAQIEAEARENEWLATPRSQGVMPPPSLTLNGEVWDLVEGNHWRRRIDSDEVLDPPKWMLVVPPGRKAKFNQSTHVVTVK